MAGRQPATPPSRARRALGALLGLAHYGALFTAGFGGTLAAVSYPRWRQIRAETVELADAHLSYSVAHPGWSFPGTAWTAPVPLDVPRERLVAQARARTYAIACPPAAPGEICPDTGDVIPRGGVFPEGRQPAGTQGWTRPLALEPVQIGELMGPDSERREHLPLAEAPDRLIKAILAAEDEDFWDHRGVNLKGVARAVVANMQGGGFKQGASTLSMQVVRNLSQRKEKTLRRKVQEALAAVALDQAVGKEAVLQMYLDAPYLGQDGSTSVCGFQAAAAHYYGVDARKLTLAQAATLAAILPAPGKFSPDRHPDQAKARRDRVLRRMALLGWPEDEVRAALSEPVTTSPRLAPEPRFPAYMQATRAWLEGELPDEVLYGSGLQVFTALDLIAQEASESVLVDRLLFLERSVGRNGDTPLQAAGAVVAPESGLLVAAYGGTVAAATDFSRATQARRQAGSSIKPLVYAMAYSQPGDNGLPGWLAHHTVRNDRHVFKNTNGWYPRNVGGRYSTRSTLAMGLAWSQNVATASLLDELGGPEPFVAFATQIGFDTQQWPLEMGLALGQGEVTPLEMARFAATVINGGSQASGRPVVTAVDASGALRIGAPPPGRQVMGEQAAALTRDSMRLVIEYGTGGASRGAAGQPGYNGPAIGKTGTTDSEKDLWFVGGTPHLAAALWIGYDKPTRIGASASDLAAPLWGWWARAMHEGLPRDEFAGQKLGHFPVCRETGLRTNGRCTLIGAPFIEGTRPTAFCPEEHPPPDPDAPKYEGLWKRKAREDAETTEAADAADETPSATAPAP